MKRTRVRQSRGFEESKILCEVPCEENPTIGIKNKVFSLELLMLQHLLVLVLKMKL